ncbi:MAG TPA: hypothetical protein VIY09_02450 [Rhizomicrobium sp.]
MKEHKSDSPPFFLIAALELSGARDAALTSAALYRRLKSDNAIWRMLSLGDEPAFLAPAHNPRRASPGRPRQAGGARNNLRTREDRAPVMAVFAATTI